jgi:DNA-binding NarL/FixJ family response regulator
VDIEQHQVIDILEGREAEPLTQWLQAHPGVSVLARDRSDAYALAGRTGALQAIQVADRFHLVKNVGDALRELVRSRRWNVPAPETEVTVSAHDPPAVEGHTVNNEYKPSPRKQAIWEAVQQAKESGMSMRAISRELGIHRNTVRKYLDAEGPPAYKLL